MPCYPTPENVEIRPQARTFILFALTLAYPMFGAGFELGAYGELIYERKITAWAVVTAVWLGFGLVPREQTGIRNWQLLALAIPCLWLLAAGFHARAGVVSPVFPVRDLPGGQGRQPRIAKPARLETEGGHRRDRAAVHRRRLPGRRSQLPVSQLQRFRGRRQHATGQL
jgi:hypothetical protein